MWLLLVSEFVVPAMLASPELVSLVCGPSFSSIEN